MSKHSFAKNDLTLTCGMFHAASTLTTVKIISIQWQRTINAGGDSGGRAAAACAVAASGGADGAGGAATGASDTA